MKYIIANWKMNMDTETIKKWFIEFEKIRENKRTQNTVIIAAGHIHLPTVKEFSMNFEYIKIGAQDVAEYEKGAHTGYTGTFQLKEYADYCIVGHSERKEERALVYTKRDICLKHGIKPIVCFTKPEDAQISFSEGALITWEDPDNISVNGVYREKDPNEIVESFKSMTEKLPQAKILYGGSVNEINAKALSEIYGMEGVLVGSASLDPVKFSTIIDAFE